MTTRLDKSGICAVLGTRRRRFFGGESLDPALIQANSVMTRQPTWMMGGDGVLDALAIMIEGNFRHLPVRRL